MCVYIYIYSKIVLCYEIMWKNIVEAQMPQMRMWRVSISRYVPKATNTNTQNM